ncbi:MAG TPA: hybrid sensor histidine kinase/response regulator [Elusimicrobia bacterium]|nr:hybrid sensor histidine kinase/response regulator [Elusimicrobiota bacterium]
MTRDTDILVVEDSPTQAELTRNILEGENYRVFLAESGAKALQMLKERRFNVILSDIEMPEMNGYEFCRKVKEDPATKDIPLILLTRLSDPGDIITGLECGADNFVTKPFKPDYLLSWIKHHLINIELRKTMGAQAGLEFFFGGKKHFLASDRMQILDILLSTYEAAVQKNRELRNVQKDLELLNSTLEAKVRERTEHLSREIKTRTKAEEDLRAASQREDMVLRTLPMAFFYAKPEKGGLTLEWVSEGMAKVSGFTPGEYLAAPDLWFSRVHPEDKEKIRSEIGCLAPGRTINTEFRWMTKEGEYRWVLASATVMDGRALGLVLDISERKALELQYRQAQKMEAVGRLAGGIAHDFNNLLTAIEGYTGFLLKSLAPDDKRREDVVEIEKAAQSAATLTRQLLTFSRQQVFKPQVIDCNAAVRDTRNMMKRLIGENITLEINLAKEECRIKADPGQLEQIIMNLIVNARDAMPNGGKVTIKTETMELSERYCRMHMEVRPGPYVMLMVSDTGCGISPEALPHIFEPFYTTKEAGKGTGLGLPTVYGVVKQSGGNIYVYSEPGLGTTFKIYLPRATEDIAAAQAPAPVELRGAETILLVEDDDGVRGFALRALRESGYTVLEARNAEEGLEICERNIGKISLVLSDTIMPGMNGHELYEIISKRCPGMKVIFMSGYIDSELANIRLTVDNLAFLQKPVSADDLVKKVREVLDSPATVKS